MPTINRRAPFRRVRRARWLPGVIGASTAQLDESGAVSDALAGVLAATLTDTATGADAVSTDAASTATLNDTGSGSDAVAGVVSATLADTGSGSDSSAAQWAQTLADTASVADAISGASVASLADTAGGADGVTAHTPGATYNYNISVGSGYTDVSPKQLVRTSGNVLYIAASNCDSYPCDASTQTLRMYKADSTGIPSGFTRKNSAGEVSGVAQWAIAIDGDDLIHVVYTQRTTTAGNITAFRYVTYDTSTDTWGTPEAIDTGTFSYSSGQGDQSCAMALDSNGIPHAVYLKSDGTQRNIYYRNRVGGTWSSAELVNDQSFGSNDKVWHPNIIFDADGRRVFAWLIGTFNDTADGTIFTRVRQTNGTWDSTVNMSGNNQALTSIDQSTSMMATSDGTYHITWIDASTTPGNKYINYAYSTDHGATWTQNNPGSGTQATHNPSLGPGANGGIRIYGHGTPDSGNHGDNLYYFEGAGGSATWGSWTQIVTSTEYDCSVNARWSQYFHSTPEIIDIAYWDENYPNNLYAGSAYIVVTGSLTDSGAGSDTVAGAHTATLADAGSGVDSTTSVIAATRADSGSGTDAVSGMAGWTIAESGAGSDAATGDIAATLAESGTVLDNVAAGGTGTATLPDTASSSDAASAQWAQTLADAGTAIETLSAVYSVAIDDPAAVVETINGAATAMLTDTAAALDAVVSGAGDTPARLTLSDAPFAVLTITIEDGG